MATQTIALDSIAEPRSDNLGGLQTFHLWTEGCQMNVADSAKLAAGLDRFGWQPSTTPEDADLVVLNTCVVRERAEQRAISKLGSLKALKRERPRLPDRRHGLHGRPQATTTCAGASPTSTTSRARSPSRASSSRRPDGRHAAASSGPTTFAGAHRPDRLRARHPRLRQVLHLLHRPLPPRPRALAATIAEIGDEVAHLVHGGVREVTLLGQTVEAYGHDLGRGPTSPTSCARSTTCPTWSASASSRPTRRT